MKSDGANEKKVTQWVELVTTLISTRLQTTQSIAAADADSLARDIAHDICHSYGGDVMYVPRDIKYQLTPRDHAIYDAYHGRNIDELAKKHGITHQRIYQIVRQIRRENQASRQLSLIADPL